MNKLHLAMDDLKVESFATEGRTEGRGTVVGRADTIDDQTCWRTCVGYPLDTCYNGYTCFDGCARPGPGQTPECAQESQVCPA